MEDIINKIYAGLFEDFVWVGFGSGSGTNLQALAANVKEPAMVFSDKPGASLFQHKELKKARQVALYGWKHCGSREADGYMEKSKRYNELILGELEQLERQIGKKPDLLVLGGYMRLVMDPLLTVYEDRIINVHPSRLPANGKKRLFIGDNAVYDAITAGEEYTRSSVILVDKGEDHGEIITMGEPVAVQGDYMEICAIESDKPDIIKRLTQQYVNGKGRWNGSGHQDRQKEKSDWPAFIKALDLIAHAKVGLGTNKIHNDEWRGVYIDDKLMPYQGLEVKK